MRFAVPCILLAGLLGASPVSAKELWSLKPIQTVRPPATTEWSRTPIDAFILAKLTENGLYPAPEADRRTLLRRLCFDLIGLPPPPADVERFVADPDPRAYEKLVDALLASPAYGERWARHWLDCVHYGDTHGYDKDKIREHAWPYRDYVIRALNEDRPYDRFVKEQLAGDMFFPGTIDGIAALGFLAAGPWDYVGQVEVREGTLEKKRVRNIDRDDMVAVTMNTFVSLTAQCARCHDHKFDPISQEDYYSLQAVFAAVDRADRALPGGMSVVYAAATDFTASGEFRPTLGKPRPVHFLHRGNEDAPRQELSPGTIGVRFDLPKDHHEAARRAALAEWIVDDDNALTWRSIVNRVWHYHFGRGIVETPNDFGHMGAAPTNPELLDWLAADFRDNGKSLKRLHRLIVTSSTYRQSSAHNPAHAKIDAGNQYLWRQNRQRLDAEAVRDTVLSVSGLLDRTAGGPGFKAFGFEDDHSPRYKYAEFNPDDPASHRRSIYRLIVRSAPDPFMETLDCADPTLIVERRNETLTALQALAMLNNRFMVKMAERFGEQLQKTSNDPAAQIDLGYRLALSRPPTAEESATLLDVSKKHGLPNACRLLFNTNEFAFVD